MRFHHISRLFIAPLAVVASIAIGALTTSAGSAMAADQTFTVRGIMPKIHKMEGATVTITGNLIISGTTATLIDPNPGSSVSIDFMLKRVPESELVPMYERCSVSLECGATATGTLVYSTPLGMYLDATHVVIGKPK